MSKERKIWGSSRFRITRTDGTSHDIVVEGRCRWALENLMKAGAAGCTPIEHPGPRWSAYRWTLVHEYGVEIETKHEKHGPPFEGTHARYTLVSQVERLPWSLPVASEGKAA